MSLEITIHPKKATRSDLSRLLTDLGYVRCEHIWNWPKGSLHYHWFDDKDFESFDGIEATIYKPSDDEHGLGSCEWALHTRTRASGSPTDKNYQNETIRLARKAFGGSFYNDWHGKNRYSPFWQDPRDAPSRGIYLAYESVTDNIKAVLYSISTTESRFGKDEKKIPEVKNSKNVLEFMNQMHPMRVLYNAIVPFSVAELENFFGSCFRVLLRYDPNAQAKVKQHTRKIELEDAIAIRDGSKSLEDVVSSWYSFQNLDSTHKAYSEWLGIDFWKIIRKKRKFGRKIDVMEHRLTQIIEVRHGIIHGLDIDRSLSQKGVSEIFQTALIVIEEFIDFLEKERGKIIRDETLYPDSERPPNAKNHVEKNG